MPNLPCGTPFLLIVQAFLRETLNHRSELFPADFLRKELRKPTSPSLQQGIQAHDLARYFRTSGNERSLHRHIRGSPMRFGLVIRCPKLPRAELPQHSCLREAPTCSTKPVRGHPRERLPYGVYDRNTSFLPDIQIIRRSHF